jgi:hypothetical protein
VASVGIAFLALFTLDGLLSVSDEAMLALAGSEALGSARNLIAWTVVALTPLAAACSALSPRWPARVYLPPILAVGWYVLGGFPVSMWVAPENADLVLCGSQLGVAAFSWTLLHLAVRKSGGIRAFSDARAAWSPKRLAVFAVVWIVAGPVALVGYAALAAASWLATETDGFIELDASGVSIADRRYVREDQEVRLVAMMHLGDEATYDAVFDSFQGESTLVLEEGVTDRERLLEGGWSYAKAARALGLDAQGSISAYVEDARAASDAAGDEALWPDVWYADVDVSELSPTTVAFIQRAGRFWGADDPLPGLLEFVHEPPPSSELMLAMWEIGEMRNEHLVREIERGLASYRRVIVPWGALHLPGVARAIEDAGFVRVAESRRQLVAWSTVGAALVR